MMDAFSFKILLINLLGIATAQTEDISGVGCYPSIVYLQCSTEPEPFINILEAVFGLDPCFDGVPGACCPQSSQPNCNVSIESVNHQYYSNIIDMCEGKPVCFFDSETTGVPQGCSTGEYTNVTNYVEIIYKCAQIIPSTISPTTTVQITTQEETTTVKVPTTVPLTSLPDTTRSPEPTTASFSTSWTISHSNVSFSTADTGGITTPHCPITTAEPCPEEVPFFRNWIFVGQAIGILVLLIIIIILASCLCCSCCRKSMKNKTKYDQDGNIDDEGGFMRNPSIRNYRHSQRLQYLHTSGSEFSREQNAYHIEGATPAGPSSIEAQENAQQAGCQETLQESDENSEASTATPPRDSWDTTADSSDYEVELQKQNYEENNRTEINAIRVYPQNTTNVLHQPQQRHQTAVPGASRESEVRTFKIAPGVTLPGYTNSSQDQIITLNGMPSQRDLPPSVGHVPSKSKETRNPPAACNFSNRQSSSRNRTTPDATEAERIVQKPPKYQQRQLPEEGPQSSGQRGSSKKDNPRPKPPPPPSVPPPEEEMPDDPLPPKVPPKPVTKKTSIGKLRYVNANVTSSGVILSTPMPFYSSKPTASVGSGQPILPQESHVMPMRRNQGSIRERVIPPSPEQSRASAASQPRQPPNPQVVVPYASRALVQPFPQREIQRNVPPHSTMQQPNISQPSTGNYPPQNEEPPAYSVIDKTRSKTWDPSNRYLIQPQPINQSRTQQQQQQRTHSQQASQWLRMYDEANKSYDNKGFYV